MRRSPHHVALFLLAGTLAMAVTAHAQGITDMKKGEGGSAVQGSAGPSGAPGAASDLERCDKPMGAVAVVEPQDYVGRALARYQLGSPVGLIRLMVQQSNCFIVVERGLGMKNMMQERALEKSGQLRQDSNVGGGQMVTADYILTPAVAFSENNAGTLSQEAAAGGQTKAGSVFNEGDVLRPKIGNVRLMSKPSDAGQLVTTLGKGEEMIFMGKEEEGFLQVESSKGSGWVKKILIAR